jgi:sigma-B regulation protein RsbU (phosphoserine phosphatase)
VNVEQPEWLDQVRDVLETLNQGVIIADSCPTVVYANSQFLDMIGQSADDIIGQNIIDLYPPEDTARLISLIAQGQAEGQARFEFYLSKASGERLPVVVSARQLEDPDGRMFAIVSFTDIAEQKNAEQELRQANLKLEAREVAMEEDLRLAARVQESLAPKSLAWSAASVETYYHAARTIGGDLGLVTPGDDFLTLLVCDVSGHGIGSALVANRIYTETISQIEGGAALPSMLKHLNKFAIQNLGSFVMYFTLAAARLNRDGTSLKFAAAAHPPAMIFRPGQPARFLESASTILGCFDDAVSSDAEIEIALEPGDRVMLYTDGFSESFDSLRKMLGVEGLAEIAREASSLPLPMMKQQILDRVAAWRSGPATDDMSLILVEVLTGVS